MKKITIIFLASLFLITACNSEPKNVDETVETWILNKEEQKEMPTDNPTTWSSKENNNKIAVCPSQIKFGVNGEAIVSENNGSIKELNWEWHGLEENAEITHLFIIDRNDGSGDRYEYIAIDDSRDENYIVFYFKDRKAYCGFSRIGEDNPHLF